MGFTKYNSNEEEPEPVQVVEIPQEPEVKPEDRPYVYQESPLPADKRPY